MNPVQAIVGGLLVLFVPGYFITKALFPRGFERIATERSQNSARPVPDGILTAFLSIVLSICTSIIVGSFLGFLPAPKDCSTPPCGFFQGSATGFPYIELSLIGVSAVAFIIAAARGAFPRLMRRIAPWLNKQVNAPEAETHATVAPGSPPEQPTGHEPNVRWDLMNLHARRAAARALGNQKVAEELEHEIQTIEAGGRSD